MQLTDTQKEAIRKAKEDAKNPAIKGKCVLFDGGMLGAVLTPQVCRDFISQQ